MRAVPLVLTALAQRLQSWPLDKRRSGRQVEGTGGGQQAAAQASRTPFPKTLPTIFARSGVSAASASRGLPRHGSRPPPTARAALRT
jgi:ribose/xylose/arabinose/galactoside ABC-type transport system permease subunit